MMAGNLPTDARHSYVNPGAHRGTAGNSEPSSQHARVLTQFWREAVRRWPSQPARPREKPRGTERGHGPRVRRPAAGLAARPGHRRRIRDGTASTRPPHWRLLGLAKIISSACRFQDRPSWPFRRRRARGCRGRRPAVRGRWPARARPGTSSRRQPETRARSRGAPSPG